MTDFQIPVISPNKYPEATEDSDWCFPDTGEGILNAVEAGTTHLWANTILFASLQLQASKHLYKYAGSVSVVGQPPQLVDACDEKAFVYKVMESHGVFTVANSTTLEASNDLSSIIRNREFYYPLVAKRLRGRGSHGVKLCTNEEELQVHARFLFEESSRILVEEYLDGEEATVAVMPPSAANSQGYRR